MDDPLTAGEAIALLNRLSSGETLLVSNTTIPAKLFIEGFVTVLGTNKTKYQSKFYIADTQGDAQANSLYVYSANFTESVTSIALDDCIIIQGYLINYNGTKEVGYTTVDGVTIYSDIVFNYENGVSNQEKVNYECSQVEDFGREISETTTITLPKPAQYNDVTFTWTSSSESVVISSDTLAVTPTKNEDVIVTLTVSLGESVKTRTFTLNLKYIEPQQTGWVLVTDSTQLKVGDKIIIVDYETKGKAISTTQKTSNRVGVDFSQNLPSDNVLIITLEQGSVANTFAFKVTGGYLYAASSSSNQLKTQTTLDANGSWTVTIADEKATVKANGTNTRNLLKYNKSSNLFACYSSGQYDISIYKLSSGSSGETPIHAHQDADDNGTCDDCGQSLLIEVDFYSINDQHGVFMDTSSNPGLDEFTTYMKNLYADESAYEILLSVGDMWQGTAESSLNKGAMMTEWMNEIGFTAMTLGNHEFDWGSDYILSNSNKANFPFLAINITDNSVSSSYCKPSIVVERGGIKIGIIGAIGNCLSSISGEFTNSGNLSFTVQTQLTALVKQESTRLRNEEGCTFIVYMLHDGYYNAGNTTLSGSEFKDASNGNVYYDTSLSNGYVDLVFEGHTHKDYIITDEYGVKHIQTSGNNNNIGYVQVYFNVLTKTYSISQTTRIYNSVYGNSSIQDDPFIQNVYNEYYPTAEDNPYRVVGENSTSRNKSEILNLMAQLYYQKGLEIWGGSYNIILAGGYMSARTSSIAAGSVSYAEIFKMLPFDNSIVLGRISGSKLKSQFINTTNSNYYVYPTIDANTISNSATYYIITDTYSAYYSANGITPVLDLGKDIFARDLLSDYIKDGYWSSNPPRRSYHENVSVHFLELGNKYTGDCTLIKCGDVEVLIDAGSRPGSAETIKQYIDEYCTDGILEYVIATHAHQDHIAGFVGTSGVPGIFDAYDCRVIIDFPKTNATSNIYNSYVEKRNQEIANGAVHYTALECYNNENGASRVITLGVGVTLTILYNYYYDHTTTDENNYSVCCLLNNNGTYSLFTGDLESEGESYLVDYNDLPKCKLFKAGHHGSYTATTDKLLAVIQPEVVAVCCCCGSTEYTTNVANVFPSQAFVNRVTNYTQNIYVTTLAVDFSSGAVESLNGNIVISFNMCGALSVDCSNNNTVFPETDWFKNNRVT